MISIYLPSKNMKKMIYYECSKFCVAKEHVTQIVIITNNSRAQPWFHLQNYTIQLSVSQCTDFLSVLCHRAQ